MYAMRVEPQLHPQIPMAFAPDFGTSHLIIWNRTADNRPESRRVIHLTQVCKLVHHYIVDQSRWHLDQSPVQQNASVDMATAPARACIGQPYARFFYPEQRLKMPHPHTEIGQRALAQPCDNV